MQKHQETIGRDPLRPKADAWQKVPIMNIPRIIAAISSPPPPPPSSAAGLDAEGKPLRPQVSALCLWDMGTASNALEVCMRGREKRASLCG